MNTYVCVVRKQWQQVLVFVKGADYRIHGILAKNVNYVKDGSKIRVGSGSW